MTRLYRKLAAYRRLAFGKTERKIADHVHEYSKWYEFKGWFGFIFCCLSLLVCYVIKKEFAILQIMVALLLFGYIFMFLANILNKIALVPTIVALIVIIARQIYRFIQKY